MRLTVNVADGRFGAAFLMDSGSSCGAITGHAKPVTSVSVRHQRPFRAISGSDDNSVILHTAVPFKYEKMISTHSRFVRDVAYSPDGEMFVSVGSDGKMFLYDGKTGETKAEFDRGGATSSLVNTLWPAKLKSDGLLVESRLFENRYRRCRRCCCYL